MSRRSIVLATAIAIGAGAATGWAQAADEFVRRARDIAARIAGDDAERSKQALTDLGALSVAFVQAAENASLAGGRGREELRQAYSAIAKPLEDLRRKNEATIEDGERRIIEADGDLEAYYDSAAYQQSQYVAANVRYYLNWLHYYGATLHDGDRRRALLRDARDGFSAFAGGDPNSELTVESVLGRGLCALDLGDLKTAVADLTAVSRSPHASPERKRKAQMSLLEAHVQAGNTAGALKQSEELLAGGEPSEANWVRYMRLRALLDGAKRGGAEVGTWRAEAVALMDRLRRAGGAWEQRIAALAQEAFADADAWKSSAQTPFARWELAKLYVQKQDYSSAAPLLAEVVASTDASLAKHKPRAHYFLGLAHFRAGDFAAALAELSDGLAESDLSDAADRSDRAYLIFKAREALTAAAGEDADLAPLAAAAAALVRSYPDHAAAFEARFRLAELAQREGAFAEAIDLYAEVKGDPAVELQAAFAIAQCRFELLRLSGDADERERLLAAVGADLDAFETRRVAVPAKGSGPELEAVGAKAAVMRAVQRKLQNPPDHAGVGTALDEFEERYPSQRELLPQVVRMRLEAAREAGDFAMGLQQAEAHAALLLADLGTNAIEDLAGSFIRAGARRAGEGNRAASDTAQAVAAALYAPIVGQGDAPARTQLTLARLRENAGRLDEAAALYAAVLEASAVSTTALRGLARIAEARERYDDALGYWVKLGAAGKPGDLPWYESHYEQARVYDARGDAASSCKLLGGLRAAMPGLQDAVLREKLNALYERVCG